MPRAEGLFGEIQALIIRSLLAATKSMIQDKHSFELYGDVLVHDISNGSICDVNHYVCVVVSQDMMCCGLHH